MAKTHNKKRNVGIIFEQLVKHVSKSFVSNDMSAAKNALDILKKHYSPNSELYKEYRLFNALVKTRGLTDSLAIRVLEESKKASKNFSSTKLRNEKASLIKSINHILEDKDFYGQRVDEYRKYATIQTLLNDWRKDTSDNLSRRAIYENEVCKWLTLETGPAKSNTPKDLSDVNSLTVKIMNEKFNTKYDSSLNTEQKSLIREYVFGLANDDMSSFTDRLSSLRSSTIDEVSRFSVGCDNKILNKKILNVCENLKALPLEGVNDKILSRYLTLSKLKEELQEKSDG